MLDDGRYCGLRGATGETFRGVKNKKELSLGSQHAPAPLCKQRGRADSRRFAQSAGPGKESFVFQEKMQKTIAHNQ